MTKYNPPEHQIEKAMNAARRDPRKLAVAYLRAQKRARDAETINALMSELDQAFSAAGSGDYQNAAANLKAARAAMQKHKEFYPDSK